MKTEQQLSELFDKNYDRYTTSDKPVLSKMKFIKVVSELLSEQLDLRNELIKYDKWCETRPNEDYSLTGVQLVNKYLSQKDIEKPEPKWATERTQYHLTCDKCCHVYWSNEAFPKPQLCDRCEQPEPIQHSPYEGKTFPASDNFQNYCARMRKQKLCDLCHKPLIGERGQIVCSCDENYCKGSEKSESGIKSEEEVLNEVIDTYCDGTYKDSKMGGVNYSIALQAMKKYAEKIKPKHPDRDQLRKEWIEWDNEGIFDWTKSTQTAIFDWFWNKIEGE